MRKAALLFVIAVWVYAAKAQFTLQPRLGFESPLTKISYDNSSFHKVASQSLPQVGVRADYQFKKGLAPYVGVFTHRPLVNYGFNDPKAGMTAYNATSGHLQMQLQAGLQYSTKALTLGKKKSVKTNQQKVSETRSSCYRSYQGCRKTSQEQGSKQQANNWSLRLQPSAGLGYIPSGKEDMQYGGTSAYRYNAGNLKTELMTGLGFEFAKNKKPVITLAINYFKGLGNNETMLVTEAGGKPVNTLLRSKFSGWNAAIGIPVSMAKRPKTTTATKPQNNNRSNYSEYYKRRCGSYRRS